MPAIEVDPIRVHCPTCQARPRERCVAIVIEAATGRMYPDSPVRYIAVFHATRRQVAKGNR